MTKVNCNHPAAHNWFVIRVVVCGICGDRLEACPVQSSVTDTPCVLAAGHPCDSAVRFHRYPVGVLDEAVKR
jgi:hypothetical protein